MPTPANSSRRSEIAIGAAGRVGDPHGGGVGALLVLGRRLEDEDADARVHQAHPAAGDHPGHPDEPGRQLERGGGEHQRDAGDEEQRARAQRVRSPAGRPSRACDLGRSGPAQRAHGERGARTATRPGRSAPGAGTARRSRWRRTPRRWCREGRRPRAGRVPRAASGGGKSGRAATRRTSSPPAAMGVRRRAVGPSGEVHRTTPPATTAARTSRRAEADRRGLGLVGDVAQRRAQDRRRGSGQPDDAEEDPAPARRLGHSPGDVGPTIDGITQAAANAPKMRGWSTGS